MRMEIDEDSDAEPPFAAYLLVRSFDLFNQPLANDQDSYATGYALTAQHQNLYAHG